MRWTLDSRLKLNNGVEIPVLGLGVFRSAPGGEAELAVTEALKAGYRHVDTAAVYGNEADVGAAIAKSGVPRSELFITTKLWNDDHGYDEARRALDHSLTLLGLEYVDLYLIHWPVEGKRHESWRALEQALADGKCRAIGVSNYTARHLDELVGRAKVVPAVNQAEYHPFLAQKETLAACRKHGIVFESYSPLTKGRRIGHPVVAEVAKKLGRTPAQVLIRWVLEHEVVVIPKSARPDRIRENMQVFDFELPPEDLARLDALDENFHTAWDPANAP